MNPTKNGRITAAVKFHDKSPRDGWVYVALIFGGIRDVDAAEKLQHKDIKSMAIIDKNKNIDENYELPIVMSLYAEQEIAITKGINWRNIVAFRAVKKNGLFDGPIYIREPLKDIDNAAYLKIINKLSGE